MVHKLFPTTKEKSHHSPGPSCFSSSSPSFSQTCTIFISASDTSGHGASRLSEPSFLEVAHELTGVPDSPLATACQARGLRQVGGNIRSNQEGTPLSLIPPDNIHNSPCLPPTPWPFKLGFCMCPFDFLSPWPTPMSTSKPHLTGILSVKVFPSLQSRW